MSFAEGCGGSDTEERGGKQTSNEAAIEEARGYVHVFQVRAAPADGLRQEVVGPT